MDFQLVNLRLLSHSLNWAIVWVTLALASLAYTIVHNAMNESAVNSSVAPD